MRSKIGPQHLQCTEVLSSLRNNITEEAHNDTARRLSINLDIEEYLVGHLQKMMKISNVNEGV